MTAVQHGSATNVPPDGSTAITVQHGPARIARSATRRTARLAAFLLALLPFGLAGCSEPVDLKQAVEVTEITSGWFDAGVVNGQNKIVPSITFRLRKKANVEISPVALNLVFKNADGSDSTFEDIYIARVEFDESGQTAPIVARSKNGYTADPPQTRADMLKNSQFRDVAIQIFAKQSSAQWAELQRVVVERQILTD